MRTSQHHVPLSNSVDFTSFLPNDASCTINIETVQVDCYAPLVLDYLFDELISIEQLQISDDALARVKFSNCSSGEVHNLSGLGRCSVGGWLASPVKKRRRSFPTYDQKSHLNHSSNRVAVIHALPEWQWAACSCSCSENLSVSHNCISGEGFQFLSSRTVACQEGVITIFWWLETNCLVFFISLC